MVEKNLTFKGPNHVQVNCETICKFFSTIHFTQLWLKFNCRQKMNTIHFQSTVEQSGLSTKNYDTVSQFT